MPKHLQLKVYWNKNFLMLAVDKILFKQYVPLTTYYFWPKTEAWEQLKLELESKPGLKNEEKVSVLNSATEIINYWREARNIEDVRVVANKFKGINVLSSHILQ